MFIIDHKHHHRNHYHHYHKLNHHYNNFHNLLVHGPVNEPPRPPRDFTRLCFFKGYWVLIPFKVTLKNNMLKLDSYLEFCSLFGLILNSKLDPKDTNDLC